MIDLLIKDCISRSWDLILGYVFLNWVLFFINKNAVIKIFAKENLLQDLFQEYLINKYVLTYNLYILCRYNIKK